MCCCIQKFMYLSICIQIEFLFGIEFRFLNYHRVLIHFISFLIWYMVLAFFTAFLHKFWTYFQNNYFLISIILIFLILSTEHHITDKLLYFHFRIQVFFEFVFNYLSPFILWNCVVSICVMCLYFLLYHLFL